MKESTIRFPSHDARTQIHALLWEMDLREESEREPGRKSGQEPEQAPGHNNALSGGQTHSQPETQITDLHHPKAVVQIIHGAAEHIERYRDFAEFLTGQGYVVCGADHVGHGKSIAAPGQLGHMPLKGGRDVLVEDVRTLRSLMTEKFPGSPYIMFGHSMGSFILREYLPEYGEGLTAAIISGTGQQSPALSAVGGFVAQVIARVAGAEKRSKLLHGLGLGAYSKRIPDARTDLDWLSTDPATVDAYIADARCGMPFSAGAYVTLTELTGRMVKPASSARIPKNLPVLFIAGEEDPVGESGACVRKAVEQFRAAGIKRVDLKLYAGKRHEVLNEREKETVYRDIADWLAGL
ncbi:MAG TPA: alpha/beta hydrolase [Coriobacteriia bacterium]|nr:alpha/beta hydrolase [Coriobacteriia bacterium]